MDVVDEGEIAAVIEVLDSSADAIVACRGMAENITPAADRLAQAFGQGPKLLGCGHGGRPAPPHHFPGGLLGRFPASAAPPRPPPALCLVPRHRGGGRLAR